MPSSDLEDFKQQYAVDWGQTIETPAFRAGFQYLSIQKINEIASLTDDQIERYSKQILGGLREFFRHENDLVTLHEREEFVMPIESQEEYISPEEEAQHQSVAEQFRKK